MKELTEGMVLIHETCDEILMDLRGNTQEVNPHIEHYLVKDVLKESYILYNLDKGYTWKVKKENMKLWLKGNKSMGIKPMFRISEEVA